MALRSTLDRFATGPYTVTRTGAGAHVNGRHVPGSESTFEIMAVVQPISGRELQVLPEGLRGHEVRVLYTRSQLLTATEDHAPDTLDLDGDGEAWEVVQVERHTALGETHYRVLVS